MAATTLTLTDFLLARIAEDEEAATMGEGWNPQAEADDVPVQFWDYGETHIGYRRFLAECEAKRQIVNVLLAFESAIGAQSNERTIGSLNGLRIAAKELALPYAAHPDYRNEWRP